MFIYLNSLIDTYNCKFNLSDGDLEGKRGDEIDSHDQLYYSENQKSLEKQKRLMGGIVWSIQFW